MHQAAASSRLSRPVRSHWRRRIVVLLLLVLIGLGVALGFSAWPAAQAARDAQSQIKSLEAMKSSLENHPTAASVHEADIRLMRLQDDIRTINGAWQTWKGPALLASRPFHSMHDTLQQLDPLLVYGRQLTEAGHTLSSALSPAVEDVSGHVSQATLPALVADLAPTGPTLRRVSNLLRQANDTRRQIDAATLPGSVRHGLSLLDEVLPNAPDELVSLTALPAALGGDGPRNYLLLPQNSTDLRATGGFIGTVAVLHADHGKFTLTRVENSYAVDQGLRPDVIPPLPLALYGWSSFLFHDGNWSADYPTTAQVLEILYRLGTKYKVDGAIAFNPPLVRQLLQLTGPIDVPGSSERLDTGNFFQRIDYEVNVLGSPNKAFAVAAYRAVFSRLLTLQNLDGKQVANILRDSVRSRDLLIYANDPAVQAAVREAGADAGIDPTTGDYLYVVDTNTCRWKINTQVHDEITYQASIQPDRSILATTTVRYTNTADKANVPPGQQLDYNEFVRVLVPAGSKLLRTTGLTAAWPANTLHHKTEFSGYFTLPSKTSRTITFQYRIPSAVNAGTTYSLLVQRQPGSGNWPVSIQVTAASPVRVLGPAQVMRALSSDIVLKLGLAGGPAGLAVPTQAPTESPIVPGAKPEPWLTVPDKIVPLSAG